MKQRSGYTKGGRLQCKGVKWIAIMRWGMHSVGASIGHHFHSKKHAMLRLYVHTIASKRTAVLRDRPKEILSNGCIVSVVVERAGSPNKTLVPMCSQSER